MALLDSEKWWESEVWQKVLIDTFNLAMCMLLVSNCQVPISITFYAKTVPSQVTKV